MSSYFGGARIARRDASGNVFYYLADHLGSSRVMAEIPSGQTTATLCYDADFYPFGGERAYTNSCQQNYKFTGKERDPESGLDDFEARFYGSSIGRFTSPDDPFVGWNLADPQSLNLYAYVQDNPINDVDPTGHCHIGNGEYTPCTFDTIDSALSGDVPIVGLSNWYPGGVSGPDTTGIARANNLEAGEQQYVHNTVEGGGWTTSTSSSYSTVHVGDNGNLVGEDYTHMTITAHDPPAWADASNAGGSWLGTFPLRANVFIHAWGQNIANEFKQGGCSAAFIDAFAEGGSSHLKIPDLPAGLGPDDAIRAGAGALAADYAAKRALIVPLRSFIFRGILEGGETAAAGAALADVYARIGEGIYGEVTSALNDTCH